MKPVPFRDAGAFRAWLERHHAAEAELYVRCFKSHARDAGMTYPEGVDEALCFGWIDGVRHRIDAVSFSVRFTPRKPKSIWSAINIRRVKQLQAAGQMAAPGRKAFAAREARNTRRYSFESKPKTLSPALARRLKANRKAWEDFEARPPWYRRTTLFWIMSAKQEATRERRLAILIASSARGTTIPLLTKSGKESR